MATAGIPLWSTTAASNASADPAVNWAEGQAPSSVNDSARGMMASVAKWRDDLYGLTTAGTSTAFTVTTNATYATATAMSGAVFTIIPNATSGAAPTLAVDGLTARALNVSTGVAVPAGALVAGTPYLIKYVHATTEFIVIGVVGKGLLSALDIINGTSEATIAADDTLPLYDLSATANRRMLVSDFLKVVNALTEDSSPDSALDYVMSYDTSATAAKKVLLRNLPGRLPRGYIDGCIISNGTDATNDINIAAGVCRDSTNTVDITVAAMSGKQLDANWAAGATAGMRNSAAGIANGTYHIYAVAKADGTQDIYAYAGVAGTDPDSSASVATVLTALQAETGGASYIYARRVASIKREDGAVVDFSQKGNTFLRKVVARDATDTAITASDTLLAMSIPVGPQFDVLFSAGSRTNNTVLFFSSPDETVQAASSTGAISYRNLPDSTGETAFIAPHYPLRSDRSGQIRVVASGSGTYDVVTRGWIDSRGRDA